MAPNRALRQARCERAGWWLAQGVELVPLKPRSKELQPGYGPRRARIAALEVARQWFLKTDANLGVVLGGRVGLAVCDWDAAPAYQAWREAQGATLQTLTEQTARGYHVFVWGESLRQAASAGCEFKTRGVCMVSPSVHPSGVVYRLVTEAPIARLTAESARRFFPFLSEAPGQHTPEAGVGLAVMRACGKPTGARAAKDGVVARIKAARSIAAEMTAAGVKLQLAGKTTLVGRCPFHDDHRPSLWVNPESGLWGCNKPGCPAAGTHDLINFRALWRGLSLRAAIKQLADEFLGETPGKR
ncbi:MAG: bifunctional DNA primase/polymerase [Anaerolineales bacterium]|nr:bifunctional DNA primase/polymerase [Anaerolineales bacterium]